MHVAVFDTLRFIFLFWLQPINPLVQPVRILIPDGDSPLAVPVLQCLHRSDMPCKVWLLHADDISTAPRSRFTHRVLRTPSALNPEAVRNAVREHGIDVVLPVSTAGILAIAELADQLAPMVRLPALPDPMVLRQLGDKWQLHQLLQDTGLPSPRTELLTGPELPGTFDPDEPVLLKPRCGQSGEGIFKVERASELDQRPDLQDLIVAGYVIQACLGGANVDRSVLCDQGRVITATVQRPLHNGNGYKPSKDLHFGHDAAVANVVDTLLESCGWSGVAHIDTVKEAGSGIPYVVDVNPRYWATLLGSFAAGINFPAIQVAVAMGLPTPAESMKEIDFISAGTWPLHFLRHGTPLSHSTVPYNLADPLPKLHLLLNRRRVIAMGR